MREFGLLTLFALLLSAPHIRAQPAAPEENRGHEVKPRPPGPAAGAATPDGEPLRMIDFTDPTYGGRIRQIFNPAGDEHDLYHYRSVFNADNSRLLGIETPKGSTDYQVTLYDGDGRFLSKL